MTSKPMLVSVLALALALVALTVAVLTERPDRWEGAERSGGQLQAMQPPPPRVADPEMLPGEGLLGRPAGAPSSGDVSMALTPAYLKLWKRYPNSSILPPRTTRERLKREARANEASYLHELMRNGLATRQEIERYHDGRSSKLREARQMLLDMLNAPGRHWLPEERSGIQNLLRAHEGRISQYESRKARALEIQQ